MVRHEVSPHATHFFTKISSDGSTRQAAEAMGAISSTTCVPILREYLPDPDRSVRETCEIALAKIEWDNSEEGKKHVEAKESSDTAPSVCPAWRLFR
jgi:HEAT repeat protein